MPRCYCQNLQLALFVFLSIKKVNLGEVTPKELKKTQKAKRTILIKNFGIFAILKNELVTKTYNIASSALLKTWETAFFKICIADIDHLFVVVSLSF